MTAPAGLGHEQPVSADDRAHVVDGVDVEAVAAAVRGCPSVLSLADGLAATAVTLLPGRRVAGVRITGPAVLVEVRSRWNVPVSDVVTELRAATAGLLAGHRLDILVSDIGDIGDIGDPPPPPAALPAPPVLLEIEGIS